MAEALNQTLWVAFADGKLYPQYIVPENDYRESEAHGPRLTKIYICIPIE